ncbi:MAG TPA: succinylglutamate desuccinylase/aspartoacylase family protein [Thermoanaerobaculia bacterium]|nr:succinylglutamate desuccinylase/aspartoacylase family protein [Thermoanaerobaculia bacterium]
MMKRLAFIALFTTSLAAQTFTAGSAAAPRGATAYGALDVPAGSDAAATIPVAVVNGAKPGPVVAFVAGSHGTEYASSIALTKLISRIDPKSLSGTAIIVPLLNEASFEQMTVHLNPIDKKGMNGQYPGDPKGTQTQRALALVAETIVKRADTIVDLHGGDLDEDLGQYSYWMRSGNAARDDASRALVLAFGLSLVIVNDVDLTNPAATRSLSGYSLSLGKNVVVAEAGHTGTVEQNDVNALIDGCLNILGALHMIDRAVTPLAHPVWVGSGTRVRADGPAIWTPAVRGGSYVADGSLLGTLTDYLGRPIKDVRSPAAGIVTFIRGVPSVWKDATLANVSPVMAEPR